MKDGTRSEISCPEMLQFYNAHMGGVDLTDQIVSLYDFERKSGKWWKKVFYKVLMMAVVNAHICDENLKIMNVNSRFPGSTHDSFIWSQPRVEEFLRTLSEEYMGSFYLHLPFFRMVSNGSSPSHLDDATAALILSGEVKIFAPTNAVFTHPAMIALEAGRTWARQVIKDRLTRSVAKLDPCGTPENKSVFYGLISLAACETDDAKDLNN
ncbi:unnamed protein product [Acanthoscelides obtectus]|uniref:PiggyBac transposable element-derived protein domain-containing protein n=1 Tax=Acanthoscelides obtectus TaxID=200917 RepID=A0A9P0MB10_ACAOB|nr:unnamed protein product [Acanthoscelides obtectus]CAK1661208.1 hypothetical protein AOBTE_LOCUS22512 [Acanthoscelides obtectus]